LPELHAAIADDAVYRRFDLGMFQVDFRQGQLCLGIFQAGFGFGDFNVERGQLIVFGAG
jgi:hypothetical protein